MFSDPITLTKDGDTILVTFRDALETGLSFYEESRKPLPLPSKLKRGERAVSPTALESAKLGLYQAMTEQGIKKAELDRRSDVSLGPDYQN